MEVLLACRVLLGKTQQVVVCQFVEQVIMKTLERIAMELTQMHTSNLAVVFINFHAVELSTTLI